MIPASRPVADFRTERMTEDDMNRKLHQMEMHRSAQEPKHPLQTVHQQQRPVHQPPHPHQPQYRQQSPYQQQEQRQIDLSQVQQQQRPATSAVDHMRVKHVYDTAIISTQAPTLNLPPRTIATQIQQIWVPHLETSIELKDETDRSFHLIELDLENCTSFEVPVCLPHKRYSTLSDVVRDLNQAVSCIKELQYKAHFDVQHGYIHIHVGNFEKVQNDPDQYQTNAHGPFRKIHGIKLEWPTTSKLATVLGHPVATACQKINAPNDLIVFRGEQPALNFGMDKTPFLHFTLPQCSKTKWIVDLPDEKNYSQTFIDTDEGNVMLVSRDDAMNALIPTTPVQCILEMKDPSRPLFDIKLPTSRSPIYIRTKSTVIV